MALQPRPLLHVERRLDVAVLRVGQARDEEVGIGPLERRRALEPHDRAVPVDLHHLAGLVLQVVGDVARGDVLGVVAAERRVALGRQAVGGGPVAVLLVEELEHHARLLELGVHVGAHAGDQPAHAVAAPPVAGLAGLVGPGAHDFIDE